MLLVTTALLSLWDTNSICTVVATCVQRISSSHNIGIKSPENVVSQQLLIYTSIIRSKMIIYLSDHPKSNTHFISKSFVSLLTEGNLAF